MDAEKYQPIPKACEDFDAIAKRLKEIEAEKAQAREKQILDD
jgi:hypothetical protein